MEIPCGFAVSQRNSAMMYWHLTYLSHPSCTVYFIMCGNSVEQVSETLHSKFDSFWEKYKLKDTSNPNFPGRLLAAVRAYNARHLQKLKSVVLNGIIASWKESCLLHSTCLCKISMPCSIRNTEMKLLMIIDIGMMY